MDRLDLVNKMDTMYPIPTALSRHNCSSHNYKRTVKKKVDRRGRFRTQPITFMEIKVKERHFEKFAHGKNYKEVDEEILEDHLKTEAPKNKSSSEMNLKKKCSRLSRSQSCRKTESGSR